LKIEIRLTAAGRAAASGLSDDLSGSKINLAGAFGRGNGVVPRSGIGPRYIGATARC